MLFRPTVAPARPCRVPSDVREFMAPALELAVVPAGREGREGRRTRWGQEREKESCYLRTETLKVPLPVEAFFSNIVDPV